MLERSAHELSIEEESILEKNLIWILGSPRSGTTWLASLIRDYDAIHFEEPLIGLHLGFLENRGLNFTRRVDKAHERKHYFFSDEFEEVWKKYLRKLILNRIYAQFPKCLSKKIVIKEPNGSMGADMISKCLPESKIIFLLRDARDVLNSQVTALSEGGYAAKASKIWKPLLKDKRMNHIKAACYQYLAIIEIVQKAFKSHMGQNRIMIRYEDLRQDNKNHLKKILEFVGFSYNGAKMDQVIEKHTFENIPEEEKGMGTTRQFAKVGIWKERFSNEEIKTIEEILGSKLKELGY
jgi:LPS sulfotransferase NodH